MLRQQPLQMHATLTLDDVAQVLAVDGDGVERDERGRRLLRQPCNARGGGMESHLQ